jgi:hypothetical protein
MFGLIGVNGICFKGVGSFLLQSLICKRSDGSPTLYISAPEPSFPPPKPPPNDKRLKEGDSVEVASALVRGVVVADCLGLEDAIGLYS